MSTKIKCRKDFYSGLIFIGFGAFFFILARGYPMGSLLRMGPSYFPTVLGGMLIALGLFIAARSLFILGDSINTIYFRPLLLVLGAVVVYGELLDRAGLIAATVALIFMSAFAGHEFRFKEVVILAATMAALAVGAFVYGLGLPMKLWPEF